MRGDNTIHKLVVFFFAALAIGNPVSAQLPNAGKNIPAQLSSFLCRSAGPGVARDVIPAFFYRAVNIINGLNAFSPRQLIINPQADTYRTNSIYLYLLCLGPRPSYSMRRYSNNCTYLGDEKSIVCDAGIVEEFFSDEAYANARIPPNGRSNATALATWIIAHEIGHLINGDGAASFGVGTQALALPALTAFQKREVEADRFAGKLLLNTEVWNNLIGFLSYDLMYAELRKVDPEQVFAPSVGAPLPTETIDLFSCGSHPHYVFRALSILSYDRRNAVAAPLDEMLKTIAQKNCRE